MAAVIRLYRRFYRITPSSEAGDTYTLIDPTAITAKTYLRDTATEVESVSAVNNESAGIYFVDLTPSLYYYKYEYDLKWFVDYTTFSGQKTLKTTFKIKPSSNFSYDISTEIQNESGIETEIRDEEIEVVIINQT
jgi:hypothetical protein